MTQREFAVPMGVQEGEARAARVAVEAGAAAKAKAHTVYRLADGTRVPGVTTVLSVLAKPALVPWANRLGLQGIDVATYVDELAIIGTIAHALILEHVSGTPFDRRQYSPDQIDRAENSFLKYLDWTKGKTIRVVCCERPFVSERYRYGGTLDFLGFIDDVLTVTDYKSGRAIYDEHLFQAAAYAELAREAGYRVEAVRILQIGRTEEEGFSERIIRDTGPYFDVFEHALAIYRLQQQIRKARG